MNKYKYTGPIMLFKVGACNDVELCKGMGVWAEVNINIATIKGIIRDGYELMFDPLSYDVAAKYLEPIKPETINFMNDDDKNSARHVVDMIMNDDDHEIGGNHYSKMVIEPWDYIYANKLGFDEGSVVKYISRHKDKNGAEDVKKVISFCNHILKTQYGE